jgi:hypothetical protein
VLHYSVPIEGSMLTPPIGGTNKSEKDIRR